MEKQYSHVVLIVDDEKQVGDAVIRILKTMDVAFAYAPSGKDALEKIRKIHRPFSLIITGQRMSYMTGAQFLEKARILTPDTVRFLMSGALDMAAIIAAVNKGAINRYISKPWDDNTFINIIRNGLTLYESNVENGQLLKLAKEQNAKLYMLNCDLKEKTQEHKQLISALDMKIAQLKEQITMAKQDGSSEKAQKKANDKLLDRVVTALTDQEEVEAFYARSMETLHGQFQEIAAQNGFEMF